MNNKTLKRAAALMLVMLMLLTALASCSSDSGNAADTTAADTTAETTAEVTELTPYTYLEKVDYEGYGFRVQVPVQATKIFPHVVIPSEQTGEIIYDAAYERNQYVAEYFNVDIVLVEDGSSADAAAKLQAAILAGEDMCDVTLVSIPHAGGMAVEGLFMDVNTIDSMRPDMPWYTAVANESIEVNGILPMVASSFTMQSLGCVYSLVFNQSMADKYNIPDMYDTVLAGEWTHDKLVEYSAIVTEDKDGDGNMTMEDQYGFSIASGLSAGNDPCVMQQYGMGQFTTQKNADGMPELILNNERAVSIAEKLKALYQGDSIMKAHTAWNEPMIAFRDGKSLFVINVIMQIMNNYREMEDNYGVLPMPKYDETQDAYYTSVSLASTHLEAIPITVADPERAGAIFEACVYEGYQRIIPAFYETSMKVKFSRDDTTAQVFDIIRDSVVIDFGLIYDNGIKMTHITSRVATTNDEFSSVYASLEASALAQYEKVLEAFTK